MNEENEQEVKGIISNEVMAQTKVLYRYRIICRNKCIFIWDLGMYLLQSQLSKKKQFIMEMN